MKPLSRALVPLMTYALPWLAGALLACAPAIAQTQFNPSGDAGNNASGPIRLRQSPSERDAQLLRDQQLRRDARPARIEYRPGEFERYVQRLAERSVDPEDDMFRFPSDGLPDNRRAVEDGPEVRQVPMDSPAHRDPPSRRRTRRR